MASSSDRGTQSEQEETLNTPKGELRSLHRPCYQAWEAGLSSGPNFANPLIFPDSFFILALEPWSCSLDGGFEAERRARLPRASASSHFLRLKSPPCPLNLICKLNVCLSHLALPHHHTIRYPLKCSMASSLRHPHSGAKKELRITKLSWF